VLTLIRITIVVLLAAVVAVFAGKDAIADDGNAGDMIHAYRVWKLTEAMDLSEEAMPVFFSRLRDLEDKEAELVREEHEGVREISDLLRKGNASEAELERAFEKHEAARANLMGQVRDLRTEALGMLDARQRCQYVVFEQRFRAELRDMMERARDIRQGQAGGPGPGDDFARPDPGGRGVGGGMPGGSGGSGGSGRGRR
jgi:hypothetical protein